MFMLIGLKLQSPKCSLFSAVFSPETTRVEHDLNAYYMRSIDDSFDMLGLQHLIYALRQMEILDGGKAVLSVAIAGF